MQKKGFLTNRVYDYDGKKHWPYRQTDGSNAPRCKALYIYGDPKLVVQSHYRRGWPKSSAIKMNPEADVAYDIGCWQETHCSTRDPECKRTIIG